MRKAIISFLKCWWLPGPCTKVWPSSRLNLIWQSKKFNPLGTIAIGTVKGDLHDIGKNLVQ